MEASKKKEIILSTFTVVCKMILNYENKKKNRKTKQEILVPFGTTVVLLNILQPKYNTLQFCDIHVEAQQLFDGTLQQPTQMSKDKAIV